MDQIARNSADDAAEDRALERVLAVIALELASRNAADGGSGSRAKNQGISQRGATGKDQAC